MTSAVIFGASAYGRYKSVQLGLPRIPWTASMLLVPFFYYNCVHLKEKRFVYTSAERRSMEQNLEFYPVTRRAWNRALEQYKAETGRE